MGKKANSKKSKKSRIRLRQFAQLYKIHRLIANRGYPTTQKLSDDLEVSSRTVKRYIRFLREEIGAPVKYDKAKNGYYYTHANWEMPLEPLTEGELLAFFIAAIALQGEGGSYEDERLRRALAKISVSLPEEVSVSFECLFNSTSFQAPSHVLADGRMLDELHRAIVEEEEITFDYSSPQSGKSQRRVRPLHLHNHEGTWYVISFDKLRQDYRDFHTGRISNLKKTNKSLDPPKNWNKDDYLSRGFGMYRGGKKTEVEIIFDEYQSQWMWEQNLFHPKEEREKLPGNKMKLSFSIGENGLEAVARFCLQYTGNFVAVKPQKLREIIREKLAKGLAQHE